MEDYSNTFHSLFVSNLSKTLNEDGIIKIFKKYGNIKSVNFCKKDASVFISYETYAETENAISSLDGQPPLYLTVKLNKKIITIDENQEIIQKFKDSLLSDDSDKIKEVGKFDESIGQKISPIDLLRLKITSNDKETIDANTFWLRVHLTRDSGRRHVIMGRGHKFYQISDPKLRKIKNFEKINENRNSQFYQYGFDFCKDFIGKCLYCFKDAILNCSSCNGFYCSKECQIADISEHHKICKKNSFGIDNFINDKLKIENSTKNFELKENAKVIISSYRSVSVIFLRSAEPDEIEKNNRLTQKIAKSALTAANLSNLPNSGDYVLAQYLDDNYYRAVVLQILKNEEKIEICYVDFGNIELTKLEKLKILPKSLINEAFSVKKVILEGIKLTPPTEEALHYLANLIDNEEILICKNIDKNVILQKKSGKSINNKINELLTRKWEIKKNSETILTLDDIDIGHLGKIGDNIFALFLETIQPGFKYVFSVNDQEIIGHITKIMPKIMKEYCEISDYYIPRNNELCVALYEDGNWYRGCCYDSKVSESTAQIYFLDFGILKEIYYKNIRRMIDDFLKPEILGCICSVQDFSSSDLDISSQVLERLKTLLSPSEIYKIEIIDFDGEQYIIKLPEIRAKLVEEGLLSV